MRELGMHSRVGAPIIVDERVWGVALVGSPLLGPLPADTEQRIAEFADLVATAIAASTTWAELVASRARIVAAADDARRRIERDLHDGAQQRLVSLGLRLRTVEQSVPAELTNAKTELSDAVSGLNDVCTELQELSRGIHPSILVQGGLRPALRNLARRSAVPVTLDVVIDRRLPQSAEVAAYYVVAEALTNADKHARASEVNVAAYLNDAILHMSIRDDGTGGADTAQGSGLIGLKDRVEALSGHFKVESRPGNGTSLYVTIPVDGGNHNS
jgi:signal transduction histidine kinase